MGAKHVSLMLYTCNSVSGANTRTIEWLTKSVINFIVLINTWNVAAHNRAQIDIQKQLLLMDNIKSNPTHAAAILIVVCIDWDNVSHKVRFYVLRILLTAGVQFLSQFAHRITSVKNCVCATQLNTEQDSSHCSSSLHSLCNDIIFQQYGTFMLIYYKESFIKIIWPNIIFFSLFFLSGSSLCKYYLWI